MSEKKKTRTVHHPVIAGRTREVPAEEAQRWKDAGWLLAAPRDPQRSAELAVERAAENAEQPTS